MKKLLWRVLLNYFGSGLLMMVFGWFLFYHPGRDTLIDLEMASVRDHNLHLCCFEQPDGSWRGLFMVHNPEGQLQLNQQIELARTLYLLPADVQFKDWGHTGGSPSKDPWVYCILAAYVTVLTWLDPVGRLMRARRSRKLLVCAILSAPGLTYVPGICRHYWMRYQVSAVVGQDFRMLSNQRGGHLGVVVILRQHPAEVEQALRDQLRLQALDRLSVVCITDHDPGELPPWFFWLCGLEMLAAAAGARWWLVRRRAVPV